MTRYRAILTIELTVQGHDYGHDDVREAVEEFLDDVQRIHMSDVDLAMSTIDLIEPEGAVS